MADYPISNIPRRIVYTGSAGVGPYAFAFEVLNNTDINVYLNDALLVLTTNYTVTISASLGTGSITLVVAAVAADRITIVGARPIERTSDFTTGGDFFAVSLNNEMDSQTILVQQVAETAERSIKAPVTDPTSINMTLPINTSRAGKTLAFDANGNPVAGDPIGNWRGNWAADVLYQKRDIVIDNTNSNVYLVITGHISIGALPISSNADVAKWALVVNAAAAAAAQAAAEAAETAAEAAETNAGTSASNASTSASNAATSATNAANSFDSFDDRYLGAKAAAPTLDNDGQALLTGALYWNTTTAVISTWSGSAWVAFPTANAAGVINTPAGNIAATNVQTALNELDAEKAALTGATFTGGINLARSTIAQHATTMNLWALANTIGGTGSAVTITAIANAPQGGASRDFVPLVGTTITNNAMFAVQGNANYVSLTGDTFRIKAITVSTYDVQIIKRDGTAVVLSNLIVGTAATIPTTGTYIAGQIVTSSAVGASVRLLGWKRLTTGAGHVLNTDWAEITSGITLGTEVATTSGTSIDFTGIPAWVKRITVMYTGVSTNGASDVIVQLGSGSIETTGYLGAGGLVWLADSRVLAYTTGFGDGVTNAAVIRRGSIVISSFSGNTWVASGLTGSEVVGLGNLSTQLIAGNKTLSAKLDRVRLTTVNGTDTFDAGSVNISWE